MTCSSFEYSNIRSQQADNYCVIYYRETSGCTDLQTICLQIFTVNTVSSVQSSTTTNKVESKRLHPDNFAQVLDIKGDATVCPVTLPCTVLIALQLVNMSANR